MNSIYALADVLVIPSLAKEAGSLTAIEGISLGIPMIVSNIGALSEYLGEYPVYVEPGDDFVDGLAKAMQQCVNGGYSKKVNPHSHALGSGWYFEQFKNII